MKCYNCDNEAVIHITEIRRGIPYDRHLCEKCAEMFLPAENSDYADYLDVMPARFTTELAEGPPPTPDELRMTGIRQHVVVVDLRAAEARRLGPERGDCFSPVWSGDSKHLAFCLTLETLNALVTTDPAGTWTRQFLRTSYGEQASWSGDSQAVVFSHPEDGGRVVLAAGILGDTLKRVSGNPSRDAWLPAWSPAADEIAFASRAMEGTREAKASCGIEVASADGRSVRRIATLEGAVARQLAWSPDGRMLAALALPTEGASSGGFAPPEGTLHVFSSDTPKGETPAETHVESTFSGFSWVRRADGRPALLAGSAGRDGATVSLIDPERRSTRTVADGLVLPAGDVSPAMLSPDGRTLVGIRADALGQIVCIDVASGRETTIEPKGEAAWACWHPRGKEIGALIRSGKGVRLEMLTPAGARREVITAQREDYFDAPRMVFSPDGHYAAVEAHTTVADY